MGGCGAEEQDHGGESSRVSKHWLILLWANGRRDEGDAALHGSDLPPGRGPPWSILQAGLKLPVLVSPVQVDAAHRKEAMKAMTEMFYAALFGYDEVKLC